MSEPIGETDKSPVTSDFQETLESGDVVQRARAALEGSWEGEHAIGRLIGDLADEVEKQRAEVDEDIGIIRALRRQRDEAEATIERVQGALAKPRACGHHRVVRIDDVQAALDREER